MMTIITIESDPDKKIDMLLQYAEELGISFKTEEHRVLTTKDMVNGIGRKATNAELEEYLLKGQNDTPVDFEVAFAKYLG